MHTFAEGAGVPAFLAKLWRLVEDPETNHLIYWSRDGRSFIIQNQAQFARELLPLNYKHNNMASFIRQLNMYGFHKITSIDNGGLKFDRDEMEFSHPCFKKGYPYLLEHIKRKIANSKAAIDEKAGLKPEALTKVLNEVKAMRGRQESLDSRFSSMKQENEALWREVAVLRQKHMKQQQIVNKLIQFLVTIVQPSRNMSGVKRHFQLMINDVPQSSKLRKRSESDSGPIIRELTEELLEEMAESDAELMESNSPNILSPPSEASNEIGIDIEETYSPKSRSCSSTYGQRPESTQNDNNCNASNLDNSQIVYHVSYVPEENVDLDQQFIDDNVLNNNKQQRNIKESCLQNTNQQPTTSKKANKQSINNIQRIKTENELDPLMFLEVSQENSPDIITDPKLLSPIPSETVAQQTIVDSGKPTFTTKEDFISAEIPTDLFDESPLLDDITLPSASYNSNIDLKTKCGESSVLNNSSEPKEQSPKKDLTVAKYKNNGKNNSDIMRLSTHDDFNVHLDSVQGDLDNIKDLLRGDGYQFDANTLLGNTTPAANRLVLPSSLDGDMIAKLFSDSDILSPYGLSLSNENSTDANKKGSELVTYQPYYADLSDILDINGDPLPKSIDYGNKNTKSSPTSVLNTPYPERE